MPSEARETRVRSRYGRVYLETAVVNMKAEYEQQKREDDSAEALKAFHEKKREYTKMLEDVSSSPYLVFTRPNTPIFSQDWKSDVRV